MKKFMLVYCAVCVVVCGCVIVAKLFSGNPSGIWWDLTLAIGNALCVVYWMNKIYKEEKEHVAIQVQEGNRVHAGDTSQNHD